MTLQQKHYEAIAANRFLDFPDLLEYSSIECAKISIEYAIEQLMWASLEVTFDDPAKEVLGRKINELELKLSQLNG